MDCSRIRWLFVWSLFDKHTPEPNIRIPHWYAKPVSTCVQRRWQAMHRCVRAMNFKLVFVSVAVAEWPVCHVNQCVDWALPLVCELNLWSNRCIRIDSHTLHHRKLSKRIDTTSEEKPKLVFNLFSRRHYRRCNYSEINIFTDCGRLCTFQFTHLNSRRKWLVICMRRKEKWKHKDLSSLFVGQNKRFSLI